MIEKLKSKSNINLYDVETVKELKIDPSEHANRVQDTGEFKNYENEKVTIETVSENANIADSSSYYKKKVVVPAGDIQIIVKTRD